MNEAAIRRRLEGAFESAHPKLGAALDRARVRAEVRNPAGMTELIQRGAVQHMSGGTLNVGSSTGGGNYQVQVNLTKTELSGEGAAALVLSCECREHIMKGPICKHAGAVLYCLASEGAGRGSQESPPAALGVAGSSTDGRARLVSTAAARAASALGLPASGAAGVSWEELRAKQRAVLAATAARRSKTKDCPARKEQEEPELEERMARLAITDRVPPGGRSNETVPQPPESPEQGKVMKFLDSISTHEEAIKLIDLAQEVVLFFAFTYDREDITDALLRAKAKGLEVKIGADRSNTLNGRTRNQLPKLQQLDAGGVEVNVVQGGAYAAD